MQAYIFILCPPYSGSTLLWKLLSSSSTVSALPGEGQFLPEVREQMRRDPWNPDTKLPWDEIKKAWHGYWDSSKPLLLEKSPALIIRVDEIVRHFSPVFFLLMVRNPYAHCESLMRRNGWLARQAAEFTIRCLKQQMDNTAKLKKVLCFTYEELASQPEAISRKIQTFIPQVGQLDHARKFNTLALGTIAERKITNLNAKKIENLSTKALRQINEVLCKHSDVMKYWGYSYHRPSLRHAASHLRRKLIRV